MQSHLAAAPALPVKNYVASSRAESNAYLAIDSLTLGQFRFKLGNIIVHIQLQARTDFLSSAEYQTNGKR